MTFGQSSIRRVYRPSRLIAGGHPAEVMGFYGDATPRLTAGEISNLLYISILWLFVCVTNPQGTEGIHTTNFPSCLLPQA